jgi:hypothetical protein
MKTYCAIPLLTLLGCASGEPETASTSQAVTCGSEPTDLGNGIFMSVACSWEQQYSNIQAHGVRLSGARLSANGSDPGVTVSIQCNEWLLVTDANNVNAFVSTLDGSVLSHGMVHPGAAMSNLPTTLPLPIAYTQ